MELRRYLAQKRQLVDNALNELIPGADTKPEPLHEAMRYSLFAGGKRVRPILAMAAADAVGGRGEDVLPLGVALECIHTYSLIHDDLPAMDDDDLRRGKPTAHKAFGEAMAILAGDALLTLAFEIMTRAETARIYRSDRLIRAVSEMAEAAGSQRLVAGQAMDILLEGSEPDRETVEYIMRNKTGALIRASIVCGTLLGGGSDKDINALGSFGRQLGMLFQIKDDLLDLEGDPTTLGKAVNKDSARGKATFPALFGMDKAVELMRETLDSALQEIGAFGEKGAPLAEIARYITERTS